MCYWFIGVDLIEDNGLHHYHILAYIKTLRDTEAEHKFCECPEEEHIRHMSLYVCPYWTEHCSFNI